MPTADLILFKRSSHNLGRAGKGVWLPYMRSDSKSGNGKLIDGFLQLFVGGFQSAIVCPSMSTYGEPGSAPRLTSSWLDNLGDAGTPVKWSAFGTSNEIRTPPPQSKLARQVIKSKSSLEKPDTVDTFGTVLWNSRLHEARITAAMAKRTTAASEVVYEPPGSR